MFSEDLEGALLKLGARHLIDSDFVKSYKEVGITAADTDDFWDKYRTSKQQVALDISYLYGVLQSATKNRTNPVLLKYKKSMDGLLAWEEFKTLYLHEGDKEIKSDRLEDELQKPYNPENSTGLLHYLDTFHASIEELDSLGTRQLRDVDKKRTLLKSLEADPQLLPMVLHCRNATSMTFDECWNYLRTNGSHFDRVRKKHLKSKKSTMLHTHAEDPVVTPDHNTESNEDIMKRIHVMCQETSVVHVYNTLKAPSMRESLSVPPALWKALEPELRKKILEIKDKLRKEREQKKDANQGGKPAEGEPTIIPSQYPSVNNVTKTNEELVHDLCTKLTLNDSDYDTDDDAIRMQFMVNKSTEIDHETMECRAHLEWASVWDDPSKVFAISDGGADSCVLGKHAYVESYTGRYANLVGYDPATTRSERIPIVTAYLKVKAHNDIPVLLKINEAVYNKNSPVTLLSEYQIREHGFCVDSTATKHKVTPDTHGTQRFYLNDVVHIPFVDRGAMMGFEILPIEEGDIDEIDPVYDVFEVTAPLKWTPERFRANLKIQEEDLKYFWDPDDAEQEGNDFVFAQAAFSSDYVENFLPTLSYEELTNQHNYNPEYFGYPQLEEPEHDIDLHALAAAITFGTTTEHHTLASSMKPWHRVVHDHLDPTAIRPFLGWRPLEIVRKTLENTTQMAKTNIRYPLQRHFKSRNPWATVHRLDEIVSTDPKFANCKSMYHKYTGAQVFYGLKSHHIDVYGFKSKGEFPRVYKDFIREQGAPSHLRRDNAKEEQSEEVAEVQRKLIIKDQFSEAHNQHQNPVESCAIRWLKSATHALLDATGAPDSTWYFAMKYLADVHNITYDASLKMTPHQKRHGVTPDISAFLQHKFWDPILYLDHEETWPTTKERSGRWIGVSHNVGDCLTYWIVDDQSKRVLARSVVRPYFRNLRAKWDPQLTKDPIKHTAHNGGDVMPTKELRKQLLDQSLDVYDELEESPKPHPICVTEWPLKNPLQV